MKVKSTALLLLIMVLASLAISGCNTLQGAGKDIQSAGRAIEDAVDDDEDEDDR